LDRRYALHSFGIYLPVTINGHESVALIDVLFAFSLKFQCERFGTDGQVLTE